MPLNFELHIRVHRKDEYIIVFQLLKKYLLSEYTTHGNISIIIIGKWIIIDYRRIILKCGEEGSHRNLSLSIISDECDFRLGKSISWCIFILFNWYKYIHNNFKRYISNEEIQMSQLIFPLWFDRKLNV